MKTAMATIAIILSLITGFIGLIHLTFGLLVSGLFQLYFACIFFTAGVCTFKSKRAAMVLYFFNAIQGIAFYTKFEFIADIMIWSIIQIFFGSILYIVYGWSKKKNVEVSELV